MSWHLERLAGFDLETSGISVDNDRIVTGCVVQVGGGLPVQSTTWVSDAGGIEIPAEAARIHGYDTARVRAEGQPATEVVEQITAALAQVQADGIPLVIMNAPFDLTMLDREARRHGSIPLVDILGGDKLRVIDPKVIDGQVSHRKGRRTLTDLCQHYKVLLDGAHTADADAIAACRVAWRIGQWEQSLQGKPVAELHELQVQWARSQANSRRAYFARTPGKEEWAKSVRPEWPLIPFVTAEEATA